MNRASEHEALTEGGTGTVGGTDGVAGSTVQTLDREDAIGDVIVKAQQFADETALEAQNRALALVEEAKAEAARIVNEAKLQAAVITTQQRVVVPGDVAADLFDTIDRFARTNQELATELALLRGALSTDGS